MKKSKSISPFTVIVIAICLSIIGFAFLPLLPLKLSPSEQLPSITVSFSMHNATSKVVETEVTSRLEAMFARMKGIERIRSKSQNGNGSITINLDKHTDIDAARFEIATNIRQAWTDFPSNVSYPQISVQNSDNNNNRNFIIYTINALSEASEISNNVEAVFKNGFSDINEVSAVNIYGANDKEWQLIYDVDQLQQLGINEDYITSAIQQYRYKQNIGQYTLTNNVADTTFILSNIYISLPDSSTICLDRIATLKHIDSRPYHLFRINGLNSIYLQFDATEDANQIALQKKVIERVKQLRKKLPSNYEFHIIYDSTEYISAELDKIYFRSGLTILILLIFIWLTTFSWRQVVVVSCSLICNLAIAIIAYYLLNVELQLYSLAGITISLNLIIDNTIIMADHWRREHNVTAILPIVAATLTTIGALTIVFFLDDRLRLNLYDFAVVIIINLVISIFTALWLVPALLKFQKNKSIKHLSLHRLKFSVLFNRIYSKFVHTCARHRTICIIIVIFSFGLPLFLMPKSIDSDSTGAKIYNTIFGSELYQEKIRPYTDVIFGGALRLFVEKVYNGSYWSRNEELVLSIYATLPYGSTIEQMDVLIRKMESYLSEFPQIKQFQTNVSTQQSSIQIYFTKEASHSAFPYTLKSNIISKALQLGGGSWSVYGLPDQGFSNDVRESAGSYQLNMYGYNYEHLLQWADSVKSFLLSHKRIKEVDINSSFSYYKDDYLEFHLTPNQTEMARQQISTNQLFMALNHAFINDRQCGVIWNDDKYEIIKIKSRQSEEYDIWALLNRPVEFNNKQYKISQLCNFEKVQAPQSIEKENQQYKICLQYEYIGSSIMGDRVSHEADSIYNERIPIGYTINYKRSQFYWGKEEATQYWLLALVVGVIFFITAILFNSLRLPIVIIGIIPISYIGLFLTFYLFSLNFDQGGFAALVLLCGITVNASIYIINEFQKQQHHRSLYQAYLKAFNIKIIPIMLTILSTVLGFIPFMIGSTKEAFWFPLAVGTIGGLLMSLIGIVIFLPAFVIRHKK